LQEIWKPGVAAVPDIIDQKHLAALRDVGAAPVPIGTTIVV
jgi:hypothetical protein